jgi:hypothetical protein
LLVPKDEDQKNNAQKNELKRLSRAASRAKHSQSSIEPAEGEEENGNNKLKKGIKKDQKQKKQNVAEKVKQNTAANRKPKR